MGHFLRHSRQATLAVGSHEFVSLSCQQVIGHFESISCFQNVFVVRQSPTTSQEGLLLRSNKLLLQGCRTRGFVANL